VTLVPILGFGYLVIGTSTCTRIRRSYVVIKLGDVLVFDAIVIGNPVCARTGNIAITTGACLKGPLAPLWCFQSSLTVFCLFILTSWASAGLSTVGSVAIIRHGESQSNAIKMSLLSPWFGRSAKCAPVRLRDLVSRRGDKRSACWLSGQNGRWFDEACEGLSRRTRLIISNLRDSHGQTLESLCAQVAGTSRLDVGRRCIVVGLEMRLRRALTVALQLRCPRYRSSVSPASCFSRCRCMRTSVKLVGTVQHVRRPSLRQQLPAVNK
jgi:hypothetical protein